LIATLPLPMQSYGHAARGEMLRRLGAMPAAQHALTSDRRRGQCRHAPPADAQARCVCRAVDLNYRDQARESRITYDGESAPTAQPGVSSASRFARFIKAPSQ
jgi:hypothetical protein